VETDQLKSTSFTFLGSTISFMLQVMLAPNFAILNVVPNFIMVFVIINSMFSPKIRSCLAGFVLGLLYDFISQGALGAMSFVLSVLAYAVSSLNKDLFADSWVAQAFFLLLAAFMGELFHAIFLSIFGFDNDFIASLGMRVLPGSIYAALIGLVFFVIVIMSRVAKKRKKDARIFKGRFR